MTGVPGHMRLALEEFDVPALVATVEETARGLVEAHGNRLHVRRQNPPCPDPGPCPQPATFYLLPAQ